MAKPKNWRCKTTDEVCWLTLDAPGTSQNLLSSEVIAELADALTEIEQSRPTAVVIQSGKARRFIAGADVREFIQMSADSEAADTDGGADGATSQAGLKMLALAHQTLDRLEALPMPTVALIDGHCLGGGLELALACDYRVVCERRDIRLGLPEVMLGIHPGFGGTARLCETIGVLSALELMLTGRSVDPKAARALGIVDLAVPPRQLHRAVQHLLRQKAPVRRARGWKKLLTTTPARALIAKFMRRKLAARVNPQHYPAPYQLLDLWQQHGGSRAALCAAEQTSVARLLTTPTSRNLVKVFFLREELKSIGKGGGKGGRKSAPDNAFEHVHVIGAGVMGGDIAAWCVLRGLTATVQDRDVAALARASHRAHALFKRKLKAPWRVQHAMDQFQPDLAGQGARRADVIIEAISENAEAKIGVLAEAQKVARPDALLATNTSSIPLETLCGGLRVPGALVGLHFFNPVAKMELVEIVKGAKTKSQVAHRAALFAGQIGRLPVPVKSCPGFLVNRILTPYLLEGVKLVEEGVSATLVDRAATRFGMPVGPIQLADTVGLDICLHVAQNLQGGVGEDAIPVALQQKVDAGNLGKKTGRGFYRWAAGKPQKGGSGLGKSSRNAARPNDIQDRLIFRFLNESVECLHQGIVEHRNQLDAGLIFGTGFAPFRGGPINYIVEQGSENMLQKLTNLQKKHGDRFRPAPGWAEL